MSEYKDSKWDSAPVYIVVALANLFFLLAWIFNWTDFGHNARAAGIIFHIVACLVTFVFWRYTYLLAKDKVDCSKGLAISIWVVAFILIPLLLAGFNFSIAS